MLLLRTMLTMQKKLKRDAIVRNATAISAQQVGNCNAVINAQRMPHGSGQRLFGVCTA